MNKINLIIFDLDGTLFRTETVDIEAFNCALSLNNVPTVSDERILSLMGLVLEEVCAILIKEHKFVNLDKFKKDVIKFEDEAIAAHGALYAGVPEFLNNLKKAGFNLCICSNGNEEYVTAIAEKFQLSTIFTEIWYEKKGISKTQAVKILKDKYRADTFILVGDRLCDLEAAKINGGISIGASYGFGGREVEEANYIAHSIDEVEKLIFDINNPDKDK